MGLKSRGRRSSALQGDAERPASVLLDKRASAARLSALIQAQPFLNSFNIVEEGADTTAWHADRPDRPGAMVGALVTIDTSCTAEFGHHQNRRLRPSRT
jgi:hypothetical protein